MRGRAAARTAKPTPSYRGGQTPVQGRAPTSAGQNANPSGEGPKFLQFCASAWRRCPTLFVHSKLSAHACAEFCEGKIYDNSVHPVLFSRVDRFGTRVCQICISICDGVCGRDVKFKKQAQEAEQVGTQSAPSRGTQLVTEPKDLFRSVSYRFVMFRAQRKSCWTWSAVVTERSLRDSCCEF